MEVQAWGSIKGSPTPQWYFKQGNALGVWTPEEMQVMGGVFQVCFQRYFEQGYGSNPWICRKLSWEGKKDLFQARKYSWEYDYLRGETAEQLASVLWKWQRTILAREKA